MEVKVQQSLCSRTFPGLGALLFPAGALSPFSFWFSTLFHFVVLILPHTLACGTFALFLSHISVYILSLFV